MQRFGREIPSYQLQNINFVKELVAWFVQKVESEKPKPSLTVPENVKFLIKQQESKRKVKKE